MKPHVRHLRALLVAASLALLLAPARSASSAPPVFTASPPAAALPELPKLLPISFTEPDPTALKELDRLIERLGSEDDRSRTDARSAIADMPPTIVSAIRRRVQDVHATINRDEAARTLEAARKAGRKARKGQEASKKEKKEKDKKDRTRKDDDGDDGDWLDLLLASPRPKERAWQDLVSLIGMTHMLTAVGSTSAARELIQLYAYFGDLVRIDLQRQVGKLRDRAVPALIEARQHDAKMVQKWANKELDVLGRAIPGEAVASNDTQILADVLRAYGRTRDVDAVRVILSFCNSERAQLRDAARESLAAIGEPAIWQIRDQYLGLTGEKPPRAWTWDRLAREFFALYDRQRLAEIHTLMDEGVAAAATGKLSEAVDAFDKVLARTPLFERRKEMAPAYLERARQIEDGHRDEALAMTRKALRLDPNGAHAKNVESEIAYLEGELSIERGAPDRTAFERALTLDPSHDRARQGLASLEDRAAEQQSQLRRYGGPTAIGAATLLAMILLMRRRFTPSHKSTPAARDPTPSEGGGASSTVDDR
jgi:tetratricopeptide (TPR) repeat protein